MSWWQDVVISCGHVKAETPEGQLSGDVEQVGDNTGLQAATWGLRVQFKAT